jgi:nicotinamidase-related amidase
MAFALRIVALLAALSLALGQATIQPLDIRMPAYPKYNRLDREKAAVLFVDHQSGLFSLVRDQSPKQFKDSVLALADIAELYQIPVVLTTSYEQGPNGPLLPELKSRFPNASYIARPGEINAFDNADFVAAVNKTGRKQLVIGGIVTEVCVAFVALSAREMGFDVFAVVDASGTFDEMSRNSAWIRMAQNGVQLVDWFVVASEFHRDWRHQGAELGQLLRKHIPEYDAVAISHEVAVNATQQ